jgi:hypothetical protein
MHLKMPCADHHMRKLQHLPGAHCIGVVAICISCAAAGVCHGAAGAGKGHAAGRLLASRRLGHCHGCVLHTAALQHQGRQVCAVTHPISEAVEVPSSGRGREEVEVGGVE